MKDPSPDDSSSVVKLRTPRYSKYVGGSPGLVVMGGDSCSKGREFESLHHMLDGHFFTSICCENCNVWFEKTKINEKEAEDGHFKKICR